MVSADNFSSIFVTAAYGEITLVDENVTSIQSEGKIALTLHRNNGADEKISVPWSINSATNDYYKVSFMKYT